MSIFKKEKDITDMVTGKKLIRRDYRRPGQSEYFYLSKNADGSHNQIDVPDDFGRQWAGKTLPDNVKTTSACLVIDDVYGSEIKNGKVIQRGVRDNEKGYVNRKNDEKTAKEDIFFGFLTAFRAFLILKTEYCPKCADQTGKTADKQAFCNKLLTFYRFDYIFTMYTYTHMRTYFRRN